MRVAGASAVLLMGIVLAATPILSAAEVDQETAKAWDEYIQAVSSKMQQRAAGDSPFLWVDDAPSRREAVRQGEILVEPTQKTSPEKMKHGLVFDWTGAAFFPHTTIRHIFKVLNQFDRYNEFYNPAVLEARLLEDTGDGQRFSVLVSNKTAFVNTTVESEYFSTTTCLDEHRCYNVIYSTRIQQIEDYDSPREHKLPPNQGFLWRLYSIQRYQEQDGGVYAELESIALTRDVPFEFRWLAKPILQHLPRNSMVGTLQKTRRAVCAGETLAGSDSPDKRNEVERNHPRAINRAEGFR